MHLTEREVNSMLLMSAELTDSYGYLLAARRAARGQPPAVQAAGLGLDLSALAMLSMCRLPRPSCRAADLARVAEHVGLTTAALEGLLAEADPVLDLDELTADLDRLDQDEGRSRADSRRNPP